METCEYIHSDMNNSKESWKAVTTHTKQQDPWKTVYEKNIIIQGWTNITSQYPRETVEWLQPLQVQTKWKEYITGVLNNWVTHIMIPRAKKEKERRRLVAVATKEHNE